MARLFTRRLALILVAASILPLSGDVVERGPERPTTPETWSRTELYFGSDMPEGRKVTRAEFLDFIDREVTPRFPEGLTLLTGYGQFLNSQGVIVKERSRVLILLYPPDAKNANSDIQTIRERYMREFRQESVLRVDGLAAVSF